MAWWKGALALLVAASLGLILGTRAAADEWSIGLVAGGGHHDPVAMKLFEYTSTQGWGIYGELEGKSDGSDEALLRLGSRYALNPGLSSPILGASLVWWGSSSGVDSPITDVRGWSLGAGYRWRVSERWAMQGLLEYLSVRGGGAPSPGVALSFGLDFILPEIRLPERPVPSPGAPPARPYYTADQNRQKKLDAVRLGITRDQVRSAWGAPADTWSSVSTWGRVETWYYTGETVHEQGLTYTLPVRMVTFSDGRVSSVFYD